MKTALVLVLFAGCGRIEFVPLPDGSLADAPAPIDATVFDPASCPASYTITIASTTSRYRLSSADETWPNAAATCAAESGTAAFTHLVVFGTFAEQQDIMPLLGDVWVGYSDLITEGTMLAVTDEPLGPHLAPGGPGWFTLEPNNQGGEEHCVHSKLEDALNDAPCDVPRTSFCECDGIPNDPTRY